MKATPLSGTAAGGAVGTVSVPVVWDLAGYHFEAGPLVVVVCTTLITRIIVSINAGGKHRLALDVAVTALSVIVAALWVQAHGLALLEAGLTGIGFGGLGIGIISLARGPAGIALKAGWQTFLGGMATPPPAPPPQRADQDGDLLDKLDRHP